MNGGSGLNSYTRNSFFQVHTTLSSVSVSFLFSVIYGSQPFVERTFQSQEIKVCVEKSILNLSELKEIANTQLNKYRGSANCLCPRCSGDGESLHYVQLFTNTNLHLLSQSLGYNVHTRTHSTQESQFPSTPFSLRIFWDLSSKRKTTITERNKSPQISCRCLLPLQ